MLDALDKASHVGVLNLRIPGANADAGHRVASAVVERLANRIPVGLSGHFGELSVHLQVSDNATETELSAAIADALVGALDRASRQPKRVGGIGAK